jgi:hypothetical protein
LSKGDDVIYKHEFIIFIAGILNSENRTLDDPIIKKCLSKLSPYQAWLLDPENFDYNNFKIAWVKFSDDTVLLKHLGRSSKLKEVVAQELRSRPNKLLGENYVEMLI